MQTSFLFYCVAMALGLVGAFTVGGLIGRIGYYLHLEAKTKGNLIGLVSVMVALMSLLFAIVSTAQLSSRVTLLEERLALLAEKK